MLNLKSLLFLTHLCVLCLCNSLPETTPAPAASCDQQKLGVAGYELGLASGRCYKFHTQAQSWPGARAACLAEGALLAVPGSPRATLDLTALVARHPKGTIRGTLDYKRVAVGIYADDKGNWKTADGEELAPGHAEWSMGVPWESDIFPYVYMNRDGTINNSNNINKVAFICEKAPQ